MQRHDEGARGSGLSRPALIILAFASFSAALGYGVLLPHFPDIIAARVANGRDPTVIARDVAWITGLFVAASIVFSPFWGRLSDRIGRKPVLSIGLLGYAITSFLPPVSTGMTPLYAVRFANGVFAAAIAPAVLAMVADLTSDTQARGRGFAWIGIASTTGYFLGPILGGMDRPLSNALPYRIDGLSVALAVLAPLTLSVFVALRFLPSGQPPASGGQSAPVPVVKRSLANRLLLLSSIAAAAVAGFEVSIAIQARGLGLGAERLAVIFAECSFIMLIAQTLVFFPRWDPRMTRHLLIPAFAVMAVGLALSPIAVGLPGSMVVTGAVAATGGLLSPILVYWLSLASDQQRGLSQGRISAVVGLGQTAGTLAAGYLVGLSAVPDAPFLVIAAVAALAALLCRELPGQLATLARPSTSPATMSSRQKTAD